MRFEDYAAVQRRAIRHRLGHVAGLLRLRPFDGATAGGRSRERYRRVLLSGITTGMARGATLLTLVIVVPLMLSHFGQERYGLWATLSSVMILFTFADLGLGSGLMNTLAGALSRNDRELASLSVSTAFYLLCGIALTLAVGFAVAFPHVAWARVFNVSSPLATLEAGPATAVFAACCLVGLPLGIVQRIHAGYQEGFVASLWQALGSVLGLGGVLVAVHRDAGLPWVVLALAGSPVVAAAANCLWLFGSRRPWLRPQLSRVDARASRQLVRIGFGFFALQVLAVLSYQTGTLIIAHVMGARYVPQYSVPMTLFQISPWILSLVVTPLWPAYAESVVTGDFTWVEKSFRGSIGLSLLLNVPSAVLLATFGPQILRIWVGNTVQPGRFLLLSMAAWTILNSFNGPLAMLFNGLAIIRFQVICATLMTLANLTLAVLLTRRIGVAGVVVAIDTAQLLFILIPSAVYVRRLLARMRAPKSPTMVEEPERPEG